MGLIVRLLINAVVIYLVANFLPGVTVAGFGTAIIVAIVLALLNTFVKPILEILSLPITVLTLGLFLLVINVLIIKLAAYLVDGFAVRDWLVALIFGFIVSLVSSILGAGARD
ncbi:phage holin family protein [Siphonobacter aquaeclarae]|uniref:Putative membrane protein n=1 Tax=Siphonobacter aquaeclarae TaxID=563176 RepID=A0A1G9V030_9BACT|nr:phage holin family protein [Siphonobacter aquaeclarae]SDM65473.1 putative membrane protein [Siphonobacter aquaeclarae]